MEFVKLERVEAIDLDLKDEQDRDKNNFNIMAETGFNDLVDSIGTKKTKETEKFGIGVFQTYLEAQGMNLDSVLLAGDTLALAAGGDDVTTNPGQGGLTLDEIIAQFYPSARTKGGDYYSKNSIMLIRFALARYVMKTKNLDITDPTQFPNACMSFKLTVKKLQSEGKGETKHHEPVSDEDMRIIQASLDLDNNVGLQRKVFIDVMLYFCNRERDHLRSMKPGDLIFQTYEDGREYIELCNTKTKHFGNGRSRNRIMEIPGHPRCPVKTLKKYLSKLDPTQDALFQRPKSKFCQDLKIWYDHAVIGRNNLSKLMKVISEEAGCKTIYTNHCLCTTAISNLHSLGYSSRGGNNGIRVNGYFDETNFYSRTDDRDRNPGWGNRDPFNGTSTSYLQQRENLSSLDMDDSISEEEGVSIVEHDEDEYIQQEEEQRQQQQQQQQRLQQQQQQQQQHLYNNTSPSISSTPSLHSAVNKRKFDIQQQQQLQQQQQQLQQQQQQQQQLQQQQQQQQQQQLQQQQQKQHQDNNVSFVAMPSTSSPSTPSPDMAVNKRKLDSGVFMNNSTAENPAKKTKPEEKDDVDHFFCSMAETMKRLSNRTRAELKFKIHQLVHQAEIDTMYP